jgi:hypothetical protein
MPETPYGARTKVCLFLKKIKLIIFAHKIIEKIYMHLYMFSMLV